MYLRRLSGIGVMKMVGNKIVKTVILTKSFLTSKIIKPALVCRGIL